MTVSFPGRMPASDTTHLDDLTYSYFTHKDDENPALGVPRLAPHHRESGCRWGKMKL